MEGGVKVFVIWGISNSRSKLILPFLQIEAGNKQLFLKESEEEYEEDMRSHQGSCWELSWLDGVTLHLWHT